MASQADGRIVVPVWSDGGVIKALIDDNGRVVVQLAGSDITLDVNIETSDITLPVEEQSPLTNIEARGYGWDGSNWRKNPMIWGYSDTISQYGEGTAAAAAIIRAFCATPPAGQVYVYQGYNAMHNDGVNRSIFIGVYNGVSYYGVKVYQTAVSGSWYGDPLEIVVKNGEQLYAQAYLGTIGSKVFFYSRGYLMKVSE